MRSISAIGLGLALCLPATVSAAAPYTGEEGPAKPGMVRPASITAPAGEARIRISVSVISFPGVPEHAACRMLFRATNETGSPMEMATLLHTYDGYQSDLNSWLVPTGTILPGQQVERLYSCKSASFLTIDQKSDLGWPTTCVVAGERKSPCPVALKLDSNLPLLKKD